MTDAKDLAGFEERRAEVAGASLRYLVGGAGPPLVLVHGLAGAASNWVELAPLLACRYRLLIPELPGHGGSEPLAAAPTLDPFADSVVELARREGFLPASFVGHSLGGAVALRAAARFPADVSAVALLAGAGISSATPTFEGRVIVSLLGRPARAVAPFGPLIASRPWARWPVFGALAGRRSAGAFARRDGGVPCRAGAAHRRGPGGERSRRGGHALRAR